MNDHAYQPVTIAELSQRRASQREQARMAAVNRLYLPAYVNRPAPPMSDQDVDALGWQDAA